MKKSMVYMLFTCFIAGFAWSQDTRPTVAILDFEGQDISLQEVQTLTERMRSEIGATNAVRLIERKAIENIMAEQGLQQSGCTTSECAAEVGALLGVQNMVSGSFGKLGNSYTIDAKLFSVSTGGTIRSVSKTYKGEVDGLLTIIEIVAWELVGMQAPADKLAKLASSDPSQAAAVKKERKPMGRMTKFTLLLIGLGGGAYAAGLFDPVPVPLPEAPTLPN
jgi:hypothetical protein